MHDLALNFKKPLLKMLLKSAVLSFILMLSWRAEALDVPAAPVVSPIAGITFDDPPLVLPVQRNFQMAMLITSSELGRSCGRIESYGWRLEGEDQQQRVNQIFNNIVDRIRAQGYTVETKQTGSVSPDVELVTADSSEKHLLLLWSAGDIGLVMVMCETSPPLSAISPNDLKKAKNIQPTPDYPSQPKSTMTFPSLSQESPQSAPLFKRAEAGALKPQQLNRFGKPKHEDFSPLGTWVGSYTCTQGTTGASLYVKSIKGDYFEGIFRFYPIAKNPYVPQGEYVVFGEYDQDSQRILMNPGKWIKRPDGYYSTIMIGSFDPVNKTFSAFFQGITGCTSFEADYAGAGDKKAAAAGKKKTPKAKAKKSKPIPKKVEIIPLEETAPAVPLVEETAPAASAVIEDAVEAEKTGIPQTEPPAASPIGILPEEIPAMVNPQ